MLRTHANNAVRAHFQHLAQQVAQAAQQEASQSLERRLALIVMSTRTKPTLRLAQNAQLVSPQTDTQDKHLA